MQIVEAWPHVQDIVLFYVHLSCLFSFNGCFICKQLNILVGGDVVVLELLVEFVVAMVLKLAKDKSEENRHVRMVMQGHPCSLFYEEQNQSEVFAVFSSDSYSVQVALEVKGVLIACTSKHLWCHLGHLLHNSLTHRVGNGAIQECATTRGFLGL